MNAISTLHWSVGHMLRPLSGIRGMGRMCQLVNTGFLSAGASPIQKMRMRDGTHMILDLRSKTEMYSFYSGRYDDATINLIRRLLDRLESDFLDVGGNIGMYAVRAIAGSKTDRRCVCFEPMSDNALRIEENTSLNGLQNRVDVHEVALSDSCGEAALVLREDFELGASTGNASVAISEEADVHFRKVQVPMRRFDDLIEVTRSSRFRVAKVDIEGHEDFFLRGAANWIARDRPIIFSEINNWFYQKRGTTSSSVFKSSLPEDYQVALLKESGRTCRLQTCSLKSLAELSDIETIIIFPPELTEEIHLSIDLQTRA